MNTASNAALFEKIDNLLIKSDIGKYENSEFNDSIFVADYFQQDLINSFFKKFEYEGLNLPWTGYEEKFRLRKGELTIWNGINGHGKSLMLNQIMIGCIRQSARVAIASLELHPVETLKRMVCQGSGIREKEMTELTINSFLDKLDRRLFLYAETGDITPSRVIALARYVRADLNVDHLVIDSLMKCGVTEKDYAGEKSLVNSLQNIAKQTGLHIHLVTHSKKQEDELRRIGKFDVHGSTMITNMADNVFMIQRNKKKESKPEENEDQPDIFLSCEKQRHGDNWEGCIGLWFHDSGQIYRGKKQAML